jgi:hypothetical protein
MNDLHFQEKDRPVSVLIHDGLVSVTLADGRIISDLLSNARRYTAYSSKCYVSLALM